MPATTPPADASRAWGETRSRAVTWFDPVPPLALVRSMSGLEYLRGIQTGAVPPPPVAELLGMEIDDIADGQATFALNPHESHFNPIGVVHGGILCTVLDTVLGCAVHSTLQAGWAYTSIDLNVSYLRAVTLETGRITFVGTVVKRGRRVSYATAEARDAAGTLIATASSSLLVIEPAA